MKTSIESKAKAIADYLRIATRDVSPDEIEAAVLKALKEQDRDTRHACAEAVLQCEEDVSGECIWKDDAHAACMNADATKGD